MKKSGKTWDDVIEARATFDDIDEKTIKIFLAASKNTGRLPENDGLSLSELFEKLRLTENGQLKRAAIILFGKDPGKFEVFQGGRRGGGGGGGARWWGCSRLGWAVPASRA